ncbi:FecR domain-containing protein, partial [Vibrio parahaemolyticus]
TAVGEQQTVALADGAQLMLNTQTAVNVSRQQAALLEGEMMVNLPPESGALTVRLPQGEIVAQAARFSVRLWETYSDIAV